MESKVDLSTSILLEELDAVQYHNQLLSTNKEMPLEACVADEFTNQVTQDWLRDALISLDWPTKGRADRVLEVLAGYGRNYSVLAKMFRNIEMLDGSVEMVKRMPEGVTKHQ